MEKTMETQSIEINILRFLLDHPEALDTAEGVASFWAGTSDIADVNKALQRLIDTGLVQGIGKGQKALYYTNERNLIKQILGQIKLEEL